MILVMDVGNTNIKCGLFEERVLLHSWRITSKIDNTSDELGMVMLSFFNYLNLSMSDVSGIMISSVIPSMNYTLDHMCRTYFKKIPLIVAHGVATGLNILYDNPAELGSDRIVNAVAAYELYGGPCITVDFGTATSFGAISKDCEFLGGSICPGIKISAEALTLNSAKLPRIELVMPTTAINRSTITCMQSGILYGYVGMVDYILRKMKAEMSGDVRVIATGGLSDIIAAQTSMIDTIDSLLTLKGLQIIYSKNV